MNLKKATQGFTLVEMLVVIAIIAILAASLFPAIQTAMNQARATAFKTKGKSIWNAIRVANSEREPLGKDDVWPKTIKDKKNISSSLAYWQYLFSKGDGTAQDERELQVCGDLTCDLLAGTGVPVAASPSKLAEKNVSWRVLTVDDNTLGELPFIVTKNYNAATSFSGNDGVSENEDDDDATPMELDKDAEPFGDKHVVWITIGGSSKDARRKYFTTKIFLGNTAIKDGDQLDVWGM